MVYLSKFLLPSINEEEQRAHKILGYGDNAYPYGIFPYKKLDSIDFESITIFYGNNGSGKSTLLNLIAEKLHLTRSTLFSKSKYFDDYVNNLCDFQLSENDEGLNNNINLESRIITSEDIFNQILKTRQENVEIENRRSNAADDYLTNKYTKYSFNSLEDYDNLKKQNAAKSKSQRSFINSRAGREIKQFSNGETALSYFNNEFKTECLYLLDEPENSLSPHFQLQLADLIIECVRYCDCQFIIATHSPLLLSLGLVYDLDSVPCSTKLWSELENVKVYYNFFKNNEDKFH